MPRRSINWLRPLALLLLALPLAGHAAQRELLQLFVTEPYLELHTGPGRGYPVSQVVERGDSVDVLFRRTEWYKVRTERGVEGWASEDSLVAHDAGRWLDIQGGPRQSRRLPLAPLGGRRVGRRLRGRIVNLADS